VFCGYFRVSAFAYSAQDTDTTNNYHHSAMALQLKTFRITDPQSEETVNTFLQGKRTHHWSATYTDNGWNILMIYEMDRDRQRSGSNNRSNNDHHHAAKKPERERVERVEHIPDLSTEQMPLYEAIRKWRNTRAREENIKPYVLFNNKQLEDIVKAKPSDPDTLKTIIADMSPEHFEKYSGEIVGMLSAS
jgi:superfamily II DNA helicase RecQ